MHNKRCLVLGAGGFLGSTLCNYLLDKGVQVVALDRGKKPEHVYDSSLLEWVEGDFLSIQSIQQSLQSVDVVYHLISTMTPQSSNANPLLDCEQNLVGTLKLLDACVSAGVRKVIYASSGGTIYGQNEGKPLSELDSTNPSCSYAIVKLAIEKYLSLYKSTQGLDYTVLRVSNPYGEFQRLAGSQGAIGVFLGNYIQGSPISIWGDGSVVRDYVYAGDVASAFYKAWHYEGGVKVFNIGSGVGVSLNQILSIINKNVQVDLEVNYLPSRNVDLPYNVLDVSLAERELGWIPKVDLESGIKSVINYHLK